MAGNETYADWDNMSNELYDFFENNFGLKTSDSFTPSVQVSSNK